MSRINACTLAIFLSATILIGSLSVESVPMINATASDSEEEQQTGSEEEEEQQEEEQEFIATLTGVGEIPPIISNATGVANFELNDDVDAISYSIEVEDIEGATMAHIHQGSASENGDVVVLLFNGTESTDLEEGTLEEGDFTSEDFVGPLQGQNMSDLVALIQNGQAYVNIRTESNPPGEIRGTIELGLTEESTTGDDDTASEDTTSDETNDNDDANGDDSDDPNNTDDSSDDTDGDNDNN
jgi:hypothetical protein